MLYHYTVSLVIKEVKNVFKMRGMSFPYPYMVLKFLVALQLLFVVVDCFSVMTAERTVAFSHPLPEFT